MAARTRAALGLALGGLACCLTTSPLVAQQAPPSSVRTGPAAAAGATAARQTAETVSYVVDGVRIVHRTGMANDVVAANVYLLGGVRQVTPQTAGIEPLLLIASERGTRSYPREALRLAMARQGTSIVIDPGADWTMIGARATTATFDSTFVVLADRIMHPQLDPADVEQVRGQLLSGVRQRRDSPDALLSYLADSVAFGSHPYAVPASGTERSLGAITVDDLRRYQREQMVKSRMLLVVVGNVERSRVERLVRATLATLPEGSYRWSMPPAFAPMRSEIAVTPRALPTNYILGYYAGPPASSPDYAALRVASAVLSGRLFNEIRVRRNLTYAVDAPFIERAVGAGGLYVTTASPDTVLAYMRFGIEELQTGTIDPRGLEQLVQGFIVQYFMDNETNADQADFLAQAELYRGGWAVADRFVDELHAVTPADVQRVARSYMRNIRFAYLGDPRRVRPELSRIF